jgi:hypothetical protein
MQLSNTTLMCIWKCSKRRRIKDLLKICLLCFASLLNLLNTKESLWCCSVPQPWHLKLLKLWNSPNPRSIRKILKTSSKNMVFCCKFVKYKKNPQESKRDLCKVIWKGGYLKNIWCSVEEYSRVKMGVVQSYLKGRIPQENVVFCWKSVKHKEKNTQEFKMGFVWSYLKGRIPQENLIFCWKFVKHKKKNTQEFKMRVVQSYLKGRILQENLVFCRKFVKYKKKNTQGLKWELFKVIWKGGHPKKIWCSVGSS